MVALHRRADPRADRRRSVRLPRHARPDLAGRLSKCSRLPRCSPQSPRSCARHAAHRADARARDAVSAPARGRSADADRSCVSRDTRRPRRRRGAARTRRARARRARATFISSSPASCCGASARGRFRRSASDRSRSCASTRCCSRCRRSPRGRRRSSFSWRANSPRSKASERRPSPRSARGFYASRRVRTSSAASIRGGTACAATIVLVAGGSVFKSLGLVAPVHYYPKLYELVLIAVSGLHDTSVIFGVSLIVLGDVRARGHDAAQAARPRLPHARAARRALRDRAGDRELGAVAETRSLHGIRAARRLHRRDALRTRWPRERRLLDRDGAGARVRQQAQRAALCRRDRARHVRAVAAEWASARGRHHRRAPIRRGHRARCASSSRSS